MGRRFIRRRFRAERSCPLKFPPEPLFLHFALAPSLSFCRELQICAKQAGADLTGRVAQDKTTPLFMAAQSQHTGVVLALIEAKAEVDIECRPGNAAAVLSCFGSP